MNFGLWETQSKKGVTYHKGGKPVEIDGKRYWLSMFKNTNNHPNSPAYDISLEEVQEEEAPF